MRLSVSLLIFFVLAYLIFICLENASHNTAIHRGRATSFINDAVSKNQFDKMISFQKSMHKAQADENSDVDTESFQLEPGDILISNASMYSGIPGHAALAVSDDTVLHITNPSSPTTRLSFDQFVSQFTKDGKWIKIYRSKYPGAGQKAADWANRNYKGNQHFYRIDTNLSSTRWTYCSKIIFQAYKYGVSHESIYAPGSHIISPYALPSLSSSAYHFDLIHTFTS